MTAREFAVLVMQWILVVMCILGLAMICERLFENRDLKKLKRLERARRAWAKHLEKP